MIPTSGNGFQEKIMRDTTIPDSVTPPFRRGRAALALIALGLPGIASLLPILPAVEGVHWSILLVNPLLLLVVFAGLGALAAPRVGLTSRLALRVSGHRVNPLPHGFVALLGIGAVAGIAIALGDHATRALWQPAPASPPSLTEAWAPEMLALGVLYGGIVEEITMRWGVMSLAVLALWSIFARSAAAPPRAAMALGIVLAAAIFAAGHLPALVAAGVAMEPALIARTLLWNGLLGIGFGALFAARDLESAMAAHAGFHVGVAVAASLT
jgi:hypothetical protein